MVPENYRFKIGTFKCTIVRDGTFAYPYPAQILFVNAPQEQLEQVLRKYNLDLRWEQYISPYPSLLINTGKYQVLVDTGAGHLAPTTGKLMTNLRAAGISPKDIDVVILTHGHPDHIGGNLDDKGKLAFPQARYVMWQGEWTFWTSEPDLSALKMPDPLKQHILDCARKNLPPIQPQLDLIDHETEIVPGIEAIAAPGHTLGHMALAISSGSEQLLAVADAIGHPIHVEQPDWYAANDLLPEQTVITRRQLLERAAAENALMFAYHFPAPGLGYVTQKGETWQWQPLVTGERAG